ncbi:hypothetical protein LINPERPRIM_LOCUS21739 [Linum perenne]
MSIPAQSDGPDRRQHLRDTTYAVGDRSEAIL